MFQDMLHSTQINKFFVNILLNFSEHGVTLLKCTTGFIDGARAMVGIQNGIVALIKQVAQEVVNIHCVINRRALEDKKLGNEENYQLADVIKIVNATLNSPKKSHEFDELVIEIGGDRHFLYHSEVCWIFHERVMERVWNLRQEFLV